MELWHHDTAAGGKLVRGETLEVEVGRRRDDDRGTGPRTHCWANTSTASTAYLGEELVVEDLIQGESVTRGLLQDS